MSYLNRASSDEDGQKICSRFAAEIVLQFRSSLPLEAVTSGYSATCID